MYKDIAETAGRLLRRRTVQVVVGALALTLVACDSTEMSPTPSTSAALAPAPLTNQATVYAHNSTLSFDKGGNGNGNNGNGNGNGGGWSPACALPDSLVFDVTSRGATFSYNGNSIVFPKNAVLLPTHIVMVPELDSTIAMQFYPEGLIFNPLAQPTLTINTDCIGNPANAQIVYTSALGAILEWKPTKGKTANSITTTIAHFSRYAVDW